MMNLVISTLDGLDRGVSVQGEIDMATVDALERSLASLPEGPGPIVVECSQVDFMDSTGLRLLLGLVKGSKEAPAVVIRNPSPAVLRVFELSLPGDIPGLVLESRNHDGMVASRDVDHSGIEPAVEAGRRKGVTD